jgi:plasmid stabilization system protein ParE
VIADFYAVERKNPAAARRVVQAIRATCQRAGEDPLLGRARSELGEHLRSKIVLEYPYLVYFRASPRGRVEIVRILHQARDVETAFREDIS